VPRLHPAAIRHARTHHVDRSAPEAPITRQAAAFGVAGAPLSQQCSQRSWLLFCSKWSGLLAMYMQTFCLLSAHGPQGESAQPRARRPAGSASRAPLFKSGATPTNRRHFLGQTPGSCVDRHRARVAARRPTKTVASMTAVGCNPRCFPYRPRPQERPPSIPNLVAFLHTEEIQTPHSNVSAFSTWLTPPARHPVSPSP
jgi:hypothetical protein